MGSSVRFGVTAPAQDGLWFLGELAPDSRGLVVRRAYRVTGPLDRDALRAAWHTVVRRHESLRATVVNRIGRPEMRINLDVPGDAGLTITRLGDEDHLVELAVDEAVCDEASLSIVIDELSTVYSQGSTPPSPGLYTHYARQRRALDHRRELEWWRDTLTPPPAAPELPADRVRQPTLCAPSGRLRFDWRDELSTVENTGTVLLAAFQALLHRYGGEDRIAVGMPVSLRPREFAGAVGQFENLLVACTDLTGEPTFRELLKRVDTTVAEALEHRALPFHELVRALDVDRAPHRIPFCDTMFVMREPESPLRLAGTRVVPQIVEGTTRADLTLTVDGTTGTFEYRTDVFEASSASLLLDQLHTLLTAALAEPDMPVRALPLESRERTSTALDETDRIAAGPAGPDTANALVHKVADRTPDAPAVSAAGTHTSYAALCADAARITGALGAVAEKPVVVRMSTGPRQLATVLGVLDAGAHLVCLGADEVGERGRTMLADIRPARLVVDGSTGQDTLADWYAEVLDGDVLDVASVTDQAIARVPVSQSARAYVAYTSGSTGRPKGIPQSHATLSQFVTWFCGEFRIGPGARLAQWAAPGYDASLCEAFAALVAGATLCPVPDRIRANPEKIVAWLVAERITHFQTVPSFAREILRVITSGAAVPTHLDHLLLVGEALPGELAAGLRAALPSARLVNLYGPTELVLATWHEITVDGRGVTPVGRSIPGRQVLVLDEADRPCPAGVTGDIVVHSPYITPGYLGEAAGERAAFRPVAGIDGPCYRTGDLGRWRLDGTLEFRGRKDFQVKFNGIRLELGDIEAALAAHDSVAECAVVAVADANRMVSRLVAYVVPVREEDGAAAGTAADWRAALRARFGKGMPPVTFRTMLGLPRNIGGKIDRRRLPDPGGPQTDVGREAETWAERDVAALWTELGVEPRSAEDSFFAAGGHSLLVPKLLYLLRRRTGVTVSVPEFFADPTPAGLAARIESDTAIGQ